MLSSILFLGFGMIWAFQVGMTVWSLGQIRQFLAATPRISDEAALRRYKDFVRVQMHLAIFVMLLLAPNLLLCMLIAGRHGGLGLGIVLAASAVLIALGQYHKRWELRARALDAATEELKQEQQRVTNSWRKRLFPDF